MQKSIMELKWMSKLFTREQIRAGLKRTIWKTMPVLRIWEIAVGLLACMRIYKGYNLDIPSLKQVLEECLHSQGAVVELRDDSCVCGRSRTNYYSRWICRGRMVSRVFTLILNLPIVRVSWKDKLKLKGIRRPLQSHKLMGNLVPKRGTLFIVFWALWSAYVLL